MRIRSICLIAALCAAYCFHARALEPNNPLATQAQINFWAAHRRYTNEAGIADAAWQLAKATYDAADYATNSAERSLLAEQGIAACEKCLQEDQHSAAAHYYLGMNLGQLARTRGIGALKLVAEMEKEFKISATLDENFDYAGPDRNLGLLYRDAPYIASIGSRSRAHKHLQKAVDLAPGYPENRLNLIESFLMWNDRNGARRELTALEQLWPKARKTLVGEKWAADWHDWIHRLVEVKRKVEDQMKPLSSPHGHD
jgi:tetratricopeptide (TPR) repeat protein